MKKRMLVLNVFLVGQLAASANEALLNAANQGDLVGVEKALDAGANVNFRSCASQTALNLAVQNGCAQTVEILIAAGANLNLKTAEGYTPLTTAIVDKRSQIVEILIAAGADVNVSKDFGFTPLILAAIHNQEKIVAKLIQAHADVHAESGCKNRTALMWAIHYKYKQIAKILLDAGANIRNDFDCKSIAWLDGIIEGMNKEEDKKLRLKLAELNIFKELILDKIISFNPLRRSLASEVYAQRRAEAERGVQAAIGN